MPVAGAASSFGGGLKVCGPKWCGASYLECSDSRLVLASPHVRVCTCEVNLVQANYFEVQFGVDDFIIIRGVSPCV